MTLISVAEAVTRVLTGVAPLPPVDVPISAAAGRVLAVDVAAISDQPPFDKALMDGWAIGPPPGSSALPLAQSATDSSATFSYTVTAERTAGATPGTISRTAPLAPGQAIRIMTGAVVPPGTVAVVPWEAVFDERDGDVAQRATSLAIPVSAVTPGRSLLRRGSLIRAGQPLLLAGVRLTALRIAALAEQGISSVPVVASPTVCLIATGDELVESGRSLADGQIFNSNGPMLAALTVGAGGVVASSTLVADDRNALKDAIRHGLDSDVLLLTGGVSAGTHDYVPEILATLGVETIFHGVAMKPGKPVWHGRHTCRARNAFASTDNERSNLPGFVFGLPGNPLSVRVTWELFVRPLLHRLGGRDGVLSTNQSSDERRQQDGPTPLVRIATLTAEYLQTDPRPTYWPARLAFDGTVTLLPWRGSADIVGAIDANALAELPGGPITLPAGTSVPVRFLDG